jgi:hypothetical protein
MKPSSVFSLSLLSAGLVLSLASARADDPANPPAPPPAPAAPDATPADGQTPPPPHRHRRGVFVLGELTAKLSLTPEQQKTVGSIIANADGQLKTLREDESVAKEDKRAQMKTIIETTRGQIRASLTPDQQKIFDAIPTRGERGGGPPPSTPPAPTPVPTT